jgi:putative membrane protein
MPFRKKTVNATAVQIRVWSYRLFTLLCIAVYELVLLRFWVQIQVPGKPGWPEAVLLLLAVVSTIAALTRERPLQNVLLATFFIAFAGGAADWLNLKTNIPFGPVTPGAALGPDLFGSLPWALPVIWILAILASRGVARLILRPRRKLHRYGFWTIGMTTVLTVLFEFALDPFASRVKHYWFWEPTKLPLAWYGAPVVNFIGRAVVTLLILAFVTPMLINKRPHQHRPPDYHPLGIWLCAILLFAIGSATLRLWPAVVVDGIIGTLVAVFAIRGARW